MATDSPDSKLDIAPGPAPVPPTAKENPRSRSTAKPAGQPDAKTASAKGATKSGDTRQEPSAGKTAAKQATQKASQSEAKPRSSALEQMEELDKVGALTLMTLAPAWLISLIVHMVILLLFGLLAMPDKVKEGFKELVAVASEKPEAVDEPLDLPTQVPLDVDLPETEVVAAVDSVNVQEVAPLDPVDAADVAMAEASVELVELGEPTAPKTNLLDQIGSINGKGLSGRGDPNTRSQLARANGGSDASEAAVAAALKWFQEHQNGDGSWCFDHRAGKCNGRCKNEGKLNKANLAATGMALLPFLGAGQTHKEGKYKETVRGGLYYLISNMKRTPYGADMTAGGGSMYGHGICSIALCEAYAMTQDKNLELPAQAALNFIVYAQDPVGGGWRYSPRQPGDTSAVGWQIMALKSGYLAFLQVPKPVVKNANKFLDSVQADGGAQYGYTGPGPGPSTSAVGLLCRMYLGMERENAALERGVKRLADMGPKINSSGAGDMYFNYYATQVLHQYDGPDGPLWQKWNGKMRDTLIETQSKKGHETGSWFFTGDHGGETGGRLYCTSMAAMTLEIYYRYMPIYSQESAEDEWDN